MPKNSKLGKDHPKSLKVKIDEAIAAARADGWKIVHSTCVSAAKCCCPMYAVTLTAPKVTAPKKAAHSVDIVCLKAAKILDVEPWVIQAFMEGFDRSDLPLTGTWLNTSGLETKTLKGAEIKKAQRFKDMGADYRKRLRPKSGSAQAAVDDERAQIT